MTGVAGGEFGVVGRVEARDPRTGKLVWSRPTVEGYMGYKYDQDGKAIENEISGTLNQTWVGDTWKNGGAAPWNGGSYDPKTNWSISAPAIPARGTAICVLATTCFPPRSWLSTLIPARSSGTIKPRRMTAGTTIA